MKTNFLLFGTFFAVFLAGCADVLGQSESGGTANCASDFACFVQNMGNCTSATVQVIEDGVAANLKIKGASTAQVGACSVLIKITDIQKTPGMSNETWASIEAAKPGLSVLDMTCPITAEKAQSLYQEKQILAAKEVFEKCTGTLKEVALLIVVEGPKEAATPLSIEVSVFPAEAASGQKVMIVAQASGGKEPYSYSFEKEGEAAGAYSEENSIEATYTNAGGAILEKNVKATVKDANNIQAEKTAKAKIKPAAAQPVSGSLSCLDSDLGPANARVQGTIAAVLAGGQETANADYCTGADSLTEYGCSGNSIVSSTLNCSTAYPGSHCSNGACIQNAYNCTDAEPGGARNTSIWASATFSNAQGIANTNNDTCANLKMVNDYNCMGWIMPWETGVYCPLGENCIGGRCIKKWEACSDTEKNVLNYSLKGIVTLTKVGGGTDTFEDACKSQSLITEYYCTDNNATLTSVTASCPQGQVCAGGACIGQIIPCIDSDAGPDDYMTYGNVSVYFAGGGSGTNYDYCQNANSVREQSCSGSSAVSNVINCPAGKVCISGRCVSQ